MVWLKKSTTPRESTATMATFTDVKGYQVINGVPSINPAMLKIIPDYNVRDAFAPAVLSNGEPNTDEGLVRSIIANGFQADKPIVVRLVGRELFVIAGHRRLAATLEAIKRGAKIKGIAIIPEGKGAAGVRDMAEMTLDLLLSNSGEPLSPPERGAAFLRLRSYGWKDTEIAERAGVTTKWVAELCKLARLEPRLRALVKAGVVAPTLAIETAAAHGAKAADIVQAAAAKSTGAKAGKATGQTIAAVTGTPAKNAKVAPVAPVKVPAKVPSAAGRVATVVPGQVLRGPFLLGKELDDCAIFDQAGELLCELATLEVAKATLLLINQGWHTFHGSASYNRNSHPEKAPVETAPASVVVAAGAKKAGAMRTARGK